MSSPDSMGNKLPHVFNNVMNYWKNLYKKNNNNDPNRKSSSFIKSPLEDTKNASEPAFTVNETGGKKYRRTRRSKRFKKSKKSKRSKKSKKSKRLKKNKKTKRY